MSDDIFGEFGCDAIVSAMQIVQTVDYGDDDGRDLLLDSLSESEVRQLVRVLAALVAHEIAVSHPDAAARRQTVRHFLNAEASRSDD